MHKATTPLFKEELPHQDTALSIKISNTDHDCYEDRMWCVKRQEYYGCMVAISGL
jgi:hypothetical protein